MHFATVIPRVPIFNSIVGKGLEEQREGHRARKARQRVEDHALEVNRCLAPASGDLV
jgi:hypothetical protein